MHLPHGDLAMMKLPSILAGAVFGLLLGGIQAAQQFADTGLVAHSLTIGLIWAVCAGASFAAAVYLFVNSGLVRRQTGLDETELMPGEQVLHSTLANLVVKPKDFGLSKFAFGDLLWLAGMQDKEAIGGGLHLTTHRLVFRSHRLNRLRGTVSIFLPTIIDVRNSSFLLLRRLTVTTGFARIDLITPQVDQLIERIEQARSASKVPSTAAMQDFVQRPAAGLDGLQPFRAVERINQAINLANQGQAVGELAGKPLLALSSIFLKELFDRSVADPWQKLMASDGAPIPGAAGAVELNRAGNSRPSKQAVT